MISALVLSAHCSAHHRDVPLHCLYGSATTDLTLCATSPSQLMSTAADCLPRAVQRRWHDGLDERGCWCFVRSACWPLSSRAGTAWWRYVPVRGWCIQADLRAASAPLDRTCVRLHPNRSSSSRVSSIIRFHIQVAARYFKMKRVRAGAAEMRRHKRIRSKDQFLPAGQKSLGRRCGAATAQRI